MACAFSFAMMFAEIKKMLDQELEICTKVQLPNTPFEVAHCHKFTVQLAWIMHSFCTTLQHAIWRLAGALKWHKHADLSLKTRL